MTIGYNYHTCITGRLLHVRIVMSL